ncbi:MAG: class I SAM-dependent RNA methyltransferase [Rhodospirillales bacterium]|nr:class I SAM-dependent RNA methyltransferase [Rhodospirillales bacterium]
MIELGRHADGVGTVNDEGEVARCFVPFALPGETVRISVQGNSAILLDVLEKSQQRIEPFCAHFTKCGGCVIQHLNEDAYRTWKRNIVVTALVNKGLGGNSVGELIDAHGAGRRRLSLHVRAIKGGWKVGFMIAGSHQILDLDRCPVAVQDLQKVVPLARVLASAFKDTGRDLDIRFTETAEGLDCDITGAKAEGYDTLADLADCAEEHDLARVSVGGDIIVERRKPYLVMGTARVTPPSGSFLQATTLGEETLAELVREYVGPDCTTVADLFCGVGSFALRLAEQVPVYAADSNEEAINALDYAYRHTSDLKPVDAKDRNLFKNPLSEFELKPFDVVVFNPPRAGAEAQVRELVTSSINRVVAVSCDPASFARDAEILCSGGFTLDKVTPVDQFKWSSHIEVVALFTRANSS